MPNRMAQPMGWWTICFAFIAVLSTGACGVARTLAIQTPTDAEMAGYLLVPHEPVPQEFDAGFSLYVTAWPLLEQYPGDRFQTGLFGTWMFAQNEGVPHDKVYSDIEGGLGWWRDTRFATVTPKFIMGGVALNFKEWANGPGAGKGRDWEQPNGKYGVAQLSSRILWPPDGLNLKQGTCNQLFGYGYLPLPLTDAKNVTAGVQVPTGNQSWTLFLNTGNFKGPVAFFTPYFWSQASTEQTELSGMFLDTRPSEPNKALQMETQYVPALQGTDKNGVLYSRIAPTRFPINESGDSVLVHRITAYKKAALWDAVAAWFDGGDPASGQIDAQQSAVHSFKAEGGSTWKIYATAERDEKKTSLAWNSFAKPINLDSVTYGYRWDKNLQNTTSNPDSPLVTLPQYYRWETKDNNRASWVVVAADQVPAETGLVDAKFERPAAERSEPYVTPDDPNTCWKSPGPVAGPFQTKLGDGSVLTFYWYRFADQPAILNADLSDTERETLQTRIEKLHRAWSIDREYLPPPTRGELAEIDPALLVTPPAGFEFGYVPIVTRQESSE